eukprot:CAMPEP_0184656522 /NCGR_PEP_ID=MMETSP0308-20130426/16563_1 /TAXON_ID=38269 /ORGANISM="Gloeochaete witrockiana, Strain SAG 46.84" /LENGTH=305 /DNA_ID=CAMNT_0027093687 /DNA_START=131 /DNA_END=1048 /DNA_ORIENTATION=+
MAERLSNSRLGSLDLLLEVPIEEPVVPNSEEETTSQESLAQGSTDSTMGLVPTSDDAANTDGVPDVAPVETKPAEDTEAGDSSEQQVDAADDDELYAESVRDEGILSKILHGQEEKPATIATEDAEATIETTDAPISNEVVTDDDHHELDTPSELQDTGVSLPAEITATSSDTEAVDTLSQQMDISSESLPPVESTFPSLDSFEEGMDNTSISPPVESIPFSSSDSEASGGSVEGGERGGGLDAGSMNDSEGGVVVEEADVVDVFPSSSSLLFTENLTDDIEYDDLAMITSFADMNAIDFCDFLI